MNFSDQQVVMKENLAENNGQNNDENLYGIKSNDENLNKSSIIQESSPISSQQTMALVSSENLTSQPIMNLSATNGGALNAEVVDQLLEGNDEFIPVVNADEDNLDQHPCDVQSNMSVSGAVELLGSSDKQKSCRRASSLMCEAFESEYNQGSETDGNNNVVESNNDLDQYFNQTEAQLQANFESSYYQSSFDDNQYQSLNTPSVDYEADKNDQLQQDQLWSGDTHQSQQQQFQAQDQQQTDHLQQTYNDNSAQEYQYQEQQQQQRSNTTSSYSNEIENSSESRNHSPEVSMGHTEVAIEVDKYERIHVDNTSVIPGPGQTIHYKVRDELEPSNGSNPLSYGDENNPCSMYVDENNNQTDGHAFAMDQMSNTTDLYATGPYNQQYGDQYGDPNNQFIDYHQHSVNGHNGEQAYYQAHADPDQLYPACQQQAFGQVDLNENYIEDSGKTYHLLENQSQQLQPAQQSHLPVDPQVAYYTYPANNGHLYSGNVMPTVSRFYDPNVEFQSMLNDSQPHHRMVNGSNYSEGDNETAEDEEEDDDDGEDESIDEEFRARRSSSSCYRKSSHLYKSNSPGYANGRRGCSKETLKKLRTFLERRQRMLASSAAKLTPCLSSSCMSSNYGYEYQQSSSYDGYRMQQRYDQPSCSKSTQINHDECATYRGICSRQTPNNFAVDDSNAIAAPTSAKQVPGNNGPEADSHDDDDDDDDTEDEEPVVTENRQLRSRTIIISARKSSIDSSRSTRSTPIPTDRNNSSSSSQLDCGVQTRSRKRKRDNMEFSSDSASSSPGSSSTDFGLKMKCYSTDNLV